MMRLGALGLLLSLALGALLRPAPAAAHPLGNFTVNRYARLELSPERVRVRYVLDLAEIPTFQAMPQLDANRDGSVSDSEGRAYAERQLSDASRAVSLTLDGTRVPLRFGSAALELVPGQAGLNTTRISGWLEPLTPLRLPNDGAVRVELRDENDPARIGWREIVVRAEGLTVAGETVPVREVSDELRTYPEDMLMGPLDVRRIEVTVGPLGTAGGTAGSSTGLESTVARSAQPLERATDHLASLVTSVTLTPAVVLGALLTALLLGAGHALSPGHGKTIVGAYLVGARGTAQHALFLGLTVTVVHTAGVFALLLVTLFASRYVLPEAFFPWMSLASGLLVVGIGLGLVRSRLRHSRGAAHQHSHLEDELTHDHDMGTHTHAVPGMDGQPVTWKNLLALGVSGGLLPCPSALVLGLASIAIGRTLYGLVLITAFSAGLAITLVTIGLTMVYSARAAGRLRLTERLTGTRFASWLEGVRLLPVGSAVVVTLAGLALSAEALRQLDLESLLSLSTDLGLMEAGSFTLLGTALTLGLRHGIDWDHIAAIGDITSTTPPASRSRAAAINLRAVGLASLYATGHALVVVALGLAALSFGAILPEWIDPLMERLVGATLVVLGFWVVYSLVRAWRGGPDVRLQSRWMLLFSGVRRGWGAIQARLHGHAHTGVAHVHRVDRYGPKTAFGTGLIHGIGAETGTQVLLITAVGGAATQGLGVGMLLAFVTGLLVSNTAVAVLGSAGFVSARRARTVYLTVACLTAVFSLWVGSYALLGISDQLPDIQQPIVALFGEAPA